MWTFNNRPDFVDDNIFGMCKERCHLSMSRRNISDLTGVSVNMLEHYENGRRNPGMKNYNRLADFFGWKKWEAQ